MRFLPELWMEEQGENDHHHYMWHRRQSGKETAVPVTWRCSILEGRVSFSLCCTSSLCIIVVYIGIVHIFVVSEKVGVTVAV